MMDLLLWVIFLGLIVVWAILHVILIAMLIRASLTDDELIGCGLRLGLAVILAVAVVMQLCASE
jgi:membrane protein involved in colicin uptake